MDILCLPLQIHLPPPSCSMPLEQIIMDCCQWAMGWAQPIGGTSRRGESEVAAFVPQAPALLGLGWAVMTFLYPRLELLPMDPRTQPLSVPPHSAHTFANDPFTMLSLTTPCECVSDSFKDPNPQNHRHHHHYHHPGFPLGRENCRKAFGSISNIILGSLSGQKWASLLEKHQASQGLEQKQLFLTLGTTKDNFPSRRRELSESQYVRSTPSRTSLHTPTPHFLTRKRQPRGTALGWVSRMLAKPIPLLW